MERLKGLILLSKFLVPNLDEKDSTKVLPPFSVVYRFMILYKHFKVGSQPEYIIILTEMSMVVLYELEVI